MRRPDDGFDFQQEVFLDQTIDDKQRIRRIDGGAEQLWKHFRAQLHELLDVLRVNQESRELRNIVEARANAAQHCTEVIEHLPELSLEVVLAYDGAGVVDSELTSHKQQRAAVYLADVRVQALRRTGAGRCRDA